MSAGCDCTDAFEPGKREKRQKCDVFLWGLRPCLNDLSEKTAPFHLGPDRHGKTTDFSNQLSMIGKKLPPTNKLFQSCLLFHFSWRFPDTTGTSSCSEQKIMNQKFIWTVNFYIPALGPITLQATAHLSTART